jgi:hypothetical protein
MNAAMNFLFYKRWVIVWVAERLTGFSKLTLRSWVSWREMVNLYALFYSCIISHNVFEGTKSNLYLQAVERVPVSSNPFRPNEAELT